MTKRKRQNIQGRHTPRWNSQPGKLDKHMQAKKGVRNSAPGGE